MTPGKLALLLVLLFASGVSGAQSIYKCKGPDGRITYSGTPCPGEGDTLRSQQQKSASAPAPTAAKEPPAPPKEDVLAPPRTALPKGCDNTVALKAVVTRLDSPSTPDDVRAFLAEERLRLLRCEYDRLAPDEKRDREALMREFETADIARRKAAIARIDAIYDHYLTPTERAQRARNRQQ